MSTWRARKNRRIIPVHHAGTVLPLCLVVFMITSRRKAMIRMSDNTTSCKDNTIVPLK